MCEALQTLFCRRIQTLTFYRRTILVLKCSTKPESPFANPKKVSKILEQFVKGADPGYPPPEQLRLAVLQVRDRPEPSCFSSKM